MNKKNLLSLLEKYKIRPKKSFGQNFLIDPHALQKIVQTAQIDKNDWVIEVGPGLGVLTRELLKKAKKVTSIELDKKLIQILENEMKEFKNFELINMDALKFTPRPGKRYKVVANIPYNITSPLISQFLELQNRPTKMLLLIQKEVAEKICAKEGNLNVLAIHVQIFCSPKIVGKVGKNSFFPEPKICSAILEVEMLDKPLIDRKDYKKFLKIVHAGFAHKRKTILNSLSRNLKIKKDEIEKILIKLNIDIKARPQSLSIENWKDLMVTIQTSAPGRI